MRRLPSLLDRRHTTLLLAALGEGQPAIDAYRTWRASERLDDADDTVYRIMPVLLATAQRAGLGEADIPRMRGMAKHIWLSNMLRIRDLAEAKAALDFAGIDSLLIKGGALFARDERLAGLHAAGDYDLLVRRADAAPAIQALTRASFRGLDMRPELFLETDFDRDIHAVAMTKTKADRAIDLHWRPLHMLHDRTLADEMFANAEPAELFGQGVRVPGLADHLFLAAVRPEPWDQKEILLRAIEVARLLRNSQGQLDWARFESLISRYGMGWIAAPLLKLIRDEIGVPMPEGLVGRIWGKGLPGKALELSLKRLPPENRGRWQKLALSLVELPRSLPGPAASWRRLLLHPAAFSAALAACELRMPVFKKAVLRRLWARRAKSRSVLATGAVAFTEGFSIPEPEGRWTDAEYAVVEVGVGPPHKATAQIELTLIPFLPPGAAAFAFDVYAGAGGPHRCQLTSLDPMPFRLQVEAKVMGAGAAKAVVALRMLDLVSPSEIGHSVDQRLLGLFIKSVVRNNTAPPVVG